MPTKREYLINKGLAGARGRLSAAAKKEIDKAINRGIKFDVLEATSGVSETPPPRENRPEGYYTFVNPNGKKFYRLHTEACAKCSLSLRWCWCVSGPVQWAYNSASGEYATLHSVPKVGQVVPKEPRRRGRSARAA